MAISAFNLFSIGIGPSSSHTVGPMRAARLFAEEVTGESFFQNFIRIKIDLYGSLALTGKGHGTDIAIMLGLSGETPDGVDPETILEQIKEIRKSEILHVFKKKEIPFKEVTDLLFHKDKKLPFHPNGMRFSAYDAAGKELLSCVYYSVGGGFIIKHKEAQDPNAKLVSNQALLSFSFKTAEELLRLCDEHHFTIAELMMEREKSLRSKEEVKKGLLHIWDVMSRCIDKGCEKDGILPGGLNVRRRAKSLLQQLSLPSKKKNPAEVMEWVSLWALAVNEENAAFSRVVTAPTNGSAGVIPAVIKYYEHFIPDANREGIVIFLLTAAAIGILYKEGASISAAEMGCMGEVGVACSMAAAGLAAVLGATNAQIENAAEIGMEHNLGLTCDPIKGLVQIPCIERNTMGAVKAINAAMLSLRGDGKHRVSLDQVIATMKATGLGMESKFKETAQGGLAVNVPEC